MITLKTGLLSADFAELGAALVSLRYDNTEIANRGATIGRYANRIAGGRLSLNGADYQLPINDPDYPNTLHGGTEGFNKKTWSITESSGSQVEFAYTSADGEEGFPGELRVSVCYTLAKDALQIKYTAVSDKDTVFNPTNHAYFNLGGDIFATKLQINADTYTPVDENKIPTGKTRVKDTEFDFTDLRPIGRHYDHNFILREPGLAAIAAGDSLTMRVYTDMPAIQLYTEPNGFCLESQFPPNLTDLRCVLRAGVKFESVTKYAFSIANPHDLWNCYKT
jgi:aldose 1-epimerase